MLAIRKQLQPHSEWIYTVAVVLLCAIRSVGLGAREASILMAVAMLLALIKIALTDYEIREILLGVVVFGLLTYALCVNGDKMLLMSMIVIWGAKGTNIEKILVMCLFVRVPLMVARIAVAVTGILPGGEEELLKTNPYAGYSEYFVIRDYGYYHVNYLYLGLYAIGLLLLVWLEYRNKKAAIKAIALACYTVILYGAYRVLLCRTGFYMWIVLMVLVGIAMATEKMAQGRIWRVLSRVYIASPILLFVLGIALSRIRLTNAPFTYRYDALFSGRFYIFARDAGEFWRYPLARSSYMKFDNGYFYGLYNLGWITTIILLVTVVRAMSNIAKQQRTMLLMALVGTTGYMVGEATPWSVAWNPVILLLAYGLFNGMKQRTNVNE